MYDRYNISQQVQSRFVEMTSLAMLDPAETWNVGRVQQLANTKGSERKINLELMHFSVTVACCA